MARLSVTPVKGTRLHTVPEVFLERDGARDDRRFFVIDERNRMVNGKQLGELLSVVAESRDQGLRLTFPTGHTVDAPLTLGGPTKTRFYSRTQTGRLLEGPWSEALSEHVGQHVRLVHSDSPAVDRGRGGAMTLISSAALRRLAAQAERPEVDGRRFRMLVEVDGPSAHEEDGWVGARARVGDALVVFKGHVGRCLVTSRAPDTGAIDLPTLDLLRDYRGAVESTAPLPFGIYGAVVEPGQVRLGDAVTVQR